MCNQTPDVGAADTQTAYMVFDVRCREFSLIEISSRGVLV